MDNSIPVELTPIKYLEGDSNNTKRHHLQYYSGKSAVQLKIVHDKHNQYDDKALKVFYDDIFIGHIRKVYLDEDLTGMIDNLCFENCELKNIRLICNKGHYTLCPVEDKAG